MGKRKYRVLVTGADGFIGSHLCEKLVSKNYNVKALSFYNSFGSNGWLDQIDSNIKKKINIISGDIRDKSFMSSCIKNVDVIFNLAALIGIPYSYTSTESYIDTNVRGTFNILEAAKINKVKKIIHISTSEVYGTAQSIPINETHPVVGQSPYSASKIASEQLCIAYYKSFNLPITILRPFNVFGPRQSARAIVPTIISQYVQNPKFLNLGLTNTTRDFNFVNDTVEAFCKCILSKNIEGEIINIGTGKEFTIKLVTQIIGEFFGKSLQIKVEKKRLRPSKSEVMRLKSSTTKAQKLLKWKSSINSKDDFKSKIFETIEWYLKNKNLIKINPKNYQV